VAYVSAVEGALAEAFSPSLYRLRETEQSDGVYFPPHFYGELAKTKEGLDLLEASGQIPKYIECITNNSIDPIQRRAALWLLGHVGASEMGFTILDKADIVKIIVSLAETSPCLSIRGTCFYVLGMISRVPRAREKLDMLGWESPKNLNSCICVPKDAKNSPLFQLPEYNYDGSFATANTIDYPMETDEIQKEILTSVSHLSNFISAESASRTLKRIKAQHEEYFTSPSLLMEVFKLLGTYKFRLPVRRFIYDMFDGIIGNNETWKKLN